MRSSRYARRRLGCGRGAPLGLGGLALVIAIAAGCEDGVVDPSRRSPDRIPPATGCTNPNHSGPPPLPGLEPRQIAAAFGIDKLWDAGFRGQGMRVAVIAPGQGLDVERFRDFSDCWGPFATPHETVVGGGTPSGPGSEPNFDSEVLLAVAPELERIDIFGSATNNRDQLAPLLAAALDPSKTGGELVHVISISFTGCEATWTQADLEKANAQLRRAAALGVKVFTAAGDAGSVGSFRDDGDVRCVGFPIPPNPPPGVELAVTFPPSSPWVIAVGGTELVINGRIPEAGSREGGILTNEVVWNQEFPIGHLAGAGGLSKIFSVSDAPWQEALGGLAGMRHVPDVSALAGSPKFPNNSIGTSGAAPMTAGGILVVDSYLVGHGVEPPSFLSPVLYGLALTDYDRVFRDVVDGNNDVYNLGCCYAKPGYDTASGLGSIRFDQLAEVLLERAGGR